MVLVDLVHQVCKDLLASFAANLVVWHRFEVELISKLIHGEFTVGGKLVPNACNDTSAHSAEGAADALNELVQADQSVAILVKVLEDALSLLLRQSLSILP